MKEIPIAFIGGGHMTTSLIQGLLKNGYTPKDLWVADPNANKREQLSNNFGVNVTESNELAAKKAKILVLAVKPKDMQTVVKDIHDALKSHFPLIISIAAGISTNLLHRWFGNDAYIVRAMPNTPSLMGIGATGLYATSRVSEEQRDLAESLMRAVGVIVWVNHEHDMDTITALSGSGPAYFFFIMDAMVSAAEQLGLSASAAKILTLQTALGAARMALESDLSLSDLIHKVASPGGTTEKALEKLESGGIRHLLKEALEAAKIRSQEIAKHFEDQ